MKKTWSMVTVESALVQNIAGKGEEGHGQGCFEPKLGRSRKVSLRR